MGERAGAGPGETVRLEALPLDAEAFAPFGEVIEAVGPGVPINDGATVRFDDLARIDVGAEGGRVAVSLFRPPRTTLPVRVRMLERHPLGTQAFVPLGRPFLVIVAPPGDRVDPRSVRAFAGTSRQGFNYRRGVWHHPFLALGETGDVLVIDRKGPGHNLDFFELTGVELLVEGPQP